MAVNRENLYKEIWAEPMTKVAARYEISGNYLARVCQHLNVPHPPRGYWAKLEFGKAPKRSPLPDPRPGEVLEWHRGDFVPKPHEIREAKVRESSMRVKGDQNRLHMTSRRALRGRVNGIVA